MHAATSGLLSCVVEIFNYRSANITCFFAANAPVLGCHVFFGSLLQVNFTKELEELDSESDVLRGSVTFPKELSHSTVVTVAVIMADGIVGLLTINPTVNIFHTETGRVNLNMLYDVSNTAWLKTPKIMVLSSAAIA